MQKYCSLFILWLLVLSSTYVPVEAQEITSSGFEDFDMTNNRLSFIAKRFDYYYFLKQGYNTTEVMVFDTLMSRKAIVELDFLSQNKDDFTLLSNRDGFVCYFKTTDRKDSTVIQRVELNDYLRYIKRPTSIDTIDRDLEILEWVNSPSEKYTTAVCQRKVKKSLSGEDLLLLLFDQEGNKLKTLSIPDVEVLDLLSIEIDNKGTLYYTYPKEEVGKISIWISKLSDKSFNETMLTSEKYLINKIFLHQNPSNGVMYYITDFLKPQIGLSSTRGFGFGSIDTKGATNYHEVDNTDNVTLSRLFEGDNNYKLRLLNPTQDGGLIIALEEFNQKSNTIILNSGIGGGGTYSRVEYEYELGDIHILHVDKNGQNVWNNIYRKYQKSKGELDPSLSFGIINKGSSITLYYNQVQNNNKVILEGKTLYPDGSSKDIFFVWKNAKKDYSFLVSKGAQISQHEAVLPVFSQGKLGLAKIDMY